MTDTTTYHLGDKPWPPEVIADLSPDALLAEMENTQMMIAVYTKHLGRLEHQAIQIMQKEDARTIPSETYICELKVINHYDQLSFTPLKEIFHKEDWAKCLIEAHTETVTTEVKDKWLTPKVKALAENYGAKAKEVVEHARTEELHVKFARRDAK